MQSYSTGCVGLSGEFFAAAVLQRHFKAIAFATSNSPFDLICQSRSGNFYTCQVKATASTNTVNKNSYWQWSTTRNQKARYQASDANFFALVALPLRTIVFATPSEITSSVYRVREDKLDSAAENESLTRVLELIGA